MIRQILKVACCGSGYVGTPTMAVMALNNPEVQFFVYDVNSNLIDKWRQSCPIHEQGLSQILLQTRDRNLHFTSDIRKAFSDADVIYLAVPTPTKQNGEGCGNAYDMSFIETVTRSISNFYKNIELTKDVIIVEKSTVPILTHKIIQEIISANQLIQGNKDKFVVVSNPQFLAEGTSVENLTNPDRIVFGCERQDILALLLTLHRNIPAERIITTSTISAEMSKLVANCFLAQRVSSINSISILCEKTGGDILEIEKCIGSDSRIGSKFLKASVGFGGSCFKKDLLALIYLAESEGLGEVAEYWRQVVKLNEFRKQQFFQMIFNRMQRNLKGKTICVFGLSFKKNTDDLRESSSIPICSKLLIEGAIIQIFDPLSNTDKLINEFTYQGLWSKQYLSRILIKKTPIQAVADSHAIIVLTEWDEFTSYNYQQFYGRMEKPSYVFDGRNILRKSALEKLGFHYYSIGQKVL